MRRTTPHSLHGKHQDLLAARQEAEAEVARLVRETQYVESQIRQAEEQVRYYEGLLSLLRKDWGGSTPLRELVRKL